MLNDQSITSPHGEPQRSPGFLLRSSYRRCSVKKDVLKNFANFTGRSLLITLQVFRPATLLKRYSNTGAFL